jgi:hypothetical protein
MFADEQLAELAERKLRVQARITLRRMECVVTAAELARPVALADRAWDLWRQFAPMLKVVGFPLALLALRKVFGRSRRPAADGKGKSWLGTLLAALPIVLQVMQSFRTSAASTPPPGSGP